MKTRSRVYSQRTSDKSTQTPQEKKVKLASITIIRDGEGKTIQKEMQFLPNDVS